jgi:hypothetical protein
MLQRRALDERPHEALGYVAPGRLYRRSPRCYPRKLIKPESTAWRDACDVDNQRYIRWHKHKLFVTSALAGELVELERTGNWLLSWCNGRHRSGSAGTGGRARSVE